MKIELSNKTIWIAVAVIAIILVAGIFLFKGNSETFQNQSVQIDTSPSQDEQISEGNPANEIPLCSNVNYSTERINGIIKLDSASMQKLDNAVSRRANNALPGISDLTCLQELDLSGTSISDISALVGLVGMQILKLDGTGVADLNAVSGMTGLRSLSVAGTTVGQIEPVRALTSLIELNLSGTHANHLGPLENSSIEILDISQISITDSRDIGYVYNMKHLKTLNLKGTSFPSSCTEARSELPGVNIIC